MPGHSLASPGQLGQAPPCRKPRQGHSRAARKGEWKFKYALSSAHGPRQVWGIPDWHEGGGDAVHTPPLTGVLCSLPSSQLNVCLSVCAGAAPPHRDPQIQCASVDARKSTKCNVSFFTINCTARWPWRREVSGEPDNTPNRNSRLQISHSLRITV